jgi:hypothetical protein
MPSRARVFEHRGEEPVIRELLAWQDGIVRGDWRSPRGCRLPTGTQLDKLPHNATKVGTHQCISSQGAKKNDSV